jgi:hypothetical protein
MTPPDNIAPPIASCLGDLVTLSLIGVVSLGLIDWIKTPGPLVIVLLITALAVCAGVLVRRNEHVRGLLFQGWTPLFGAMIISSGTGIVLDVFVSRYRGFALLAIVISGKHDLPYTGPSTDYLRHRSTRKRWRHLRLSTINCIPYRSSTSPTQCRTDTTATEPQTGDAHAHPSDLPDRDPLPRCDPSPGMGEATVRVHSSFGCLLLCCCEFFVFL